MTSNPTLLIRIILVGLLIAELGLSAGARTIQHELAMAYRAQDSHLPLQAASHFRAVIDLEPWRTGLWLLVGRNAWDGGDSQGAIDALTQPGVATLLEAGDRLVLGDAYLAAGDMSRALQDWQQAQEAGAAPGEITRRLLDLHIAQGDYAAQVEDLKNVLALEPDNSKAYLRLGQILSTIDPAAALSYLSQAKIMDSSLAEKAGQLLDAIHTAQLGSDPAFPFLQAGRILAAQAEWALAQSAFLRATQLNPGMADAWAYLGEANYQNKPEDFTGARQALDKALQLDPRSLPANAFMALYWQRQGTPAQALPYLQQAASLEPDNPLWLVALGQVYAAQGDLPLAQQYYEKAVTLAPDQAEYHRLLAEFFIRYQIHLREGAVPAARTALSLEPDNELNLDVMGQALLLTGDRDGALVYFQRAIDKAPDYAPALLHLGVAYLEMGKTDQAYPLIEKASALNPGSSTSQQADRLLEYFFR